MEREHEMAAKRFENQRLSEQSQLHAEPVDDGSGTDTEELDDFREVWNDLERNGWYKGRESRA